MAEIMPEPDRNQWKMQATSATTAVLHLLIPIGGGPVEAGVKNVIYLHNEQDFATTGETGPLRCKCNFFYSQTGLFWYNFVIERPEASKEFDIWDFW